MSDKAPITLDEVKTFDTEISEANARLKYIREHLERTRAELTRRAGNKADRNAKVSP